VIARQVSLSYSTGGSGGTFSRVSLTGSTIKDGAIQGYVGPLQGVTLPANSSTTYTFHVALARNLPVSKKPLIAFETYLDQINTANGTGTTLGDTYAYAVAVPSVASSSSNTLRDALIAIAALVALATLGFLFERQVVRRPPNPPPAAPATP
jgi:hypothetical protein